MALTKKNIIIGAARVYLGPSTESTAQLATAKPAFVAGTRYSSTMSAADGTNSTGVGTLVTNWKEVGYTQEGLEVSNDPEWGEVEVDQLLDSAKIFKSGMSFTVSTTFAEATLENLLIAWGQSGSSVSSVAPFENELSIEGGTLGQAPTERGLIAVGNAPEQATGNVYGERVYHLYRVLSVEATSIANSRAEASVIPVSFRCLPNDNTKYGSIRDRLNVS